MKKYVISIWICVLIIAGTCDTGAGYTFEAEVSRTLTEQPPISMKIEFVSDPTNEFSRKPISWEINGKTFEQIEYEVLRSRFLTAPSILCISAQDGHDVHVFCGTFYVKCCPFLDRFGGLYRHEYSCKSEKKTITCIEELPIELSDLNSEGR